MGYLNSILLVDDDTVDNYIHQTLLSTLDITIEIIVATDGKEAMEIIRNLSHCVNCPQLILLNLDMPLMDGFEFIEEFKLVQSKIKHKVRIIILSSSANTECVQKAKMLGVEDDILKPLTEKLIIEKLGET